MDTKCVYLYQYKTFLRPAAPPKIDAVKTNCRSKKVLPDINKKLLVSGKRIEDVGGVCLIERRPFQKTSTFAFSHSEVTVFGIHFLVCMHSSVE